MTALQVSCPECGTRFPPKLIEEHPVGSANPEPHETVAFSPDDIVVAIGRPNDLIIVDRASNRDWSLWREREVRLISRG